MRSANQKGSNLPRLRMSSLLMWDYDGEQTYFGCVRLGGTDREREVIHMSARPELHCDADKEQQKGDHGLHNAAYGTMMKSTKSATLRVQRLPNPPVPACVKALGLHTSWAYPQYKERWLRNRLFTKQYGACTVQRTEAHRCRFAHKSNPPASCFEPQKRP